MKILWISDNFSYNQFLRFSVKYTEIWVNSGIKWFKTSISWVWNAIKDYQKWRNRMLGDRLLMIFTYAVLGNSKRRSVLKKALSLSVTNANTLSGPEYINLQNYSYMLPLLDFIRVPSLWQTAPQRLSNRSDLRIKCFSNKFIKNSFLAIPTNSGLQVNGWQKKGAVLMSVRILNVPHLILIISNNYFSIKRKGNRDYSRSNWFQSLQIVWI